MTRVIAKTTLLARIALELRELARQTAEIELALAAVAEGGVPSAPSRRTIQELDRVRQTQVSLACCLEALARMNGTAEAVPESLLAETPTLPSVADRLRTGRALAETRAENPEPEVW